MNFFSLIIITSYHEIISRFSSTYLPYYTYLLSILFIDLSLNEYHLLTLLFFDPWNLNLLLFSLIHSLFDTIFALPILNYLINFLLNLIFSSIIPSIYLYLSEVLLYSLISSYFVPVDCPYSSFEILLSKLI